MTFQMVIDFFSSLVGMLILPLGFLMVFHLIRKWIS